MKNLMSIVLITMVSFGCNEDEAAKGGEGEACLPDGSCNVGLKCQADLCLIPGGPDGGQPDAGPPADVQADITPPPPPPPLEWGSCDTTSWPAGYPKPPMGVQCTTVEAPLDYSQPEGPTISLRVARQPSKAFPTGKAVFNLAGGPGGSTVFQSGVVPQYFKDLRDTFDLVYVDQRGTGGSQAMNCEVNAESKQEWIDCAAAQVGVDPNHFLTAAAAHDLELVRTRMSYDKIYLRGESYGTRLALEFIRHHESTVAAVVLEGVVSADWDIFKASEEKLGWALGMLVEECEADPACKAVSPDLATDLEQRRLALIADPRPVKINGQLYGEDIEIFNGVLEAALDEPQLYYAVPRAIHQALSGDNAEWNKIMSTILQTTITDGYSGLVPDPILGSRSLPRLRVDRARRQGLELFGDVPLIAQGLGQAVLCADFLPNSDGVAALLEMAENKLWGDFYMLFRAQACAAWSVEPTAPELRAPVTSAVKTLLVNGEIDIRTPVEQAVHAAESLSNGTTVVVPHAGHTSSSPCVIDIITDFFVAEGEMATVDTACLATLTHPAW